MELRTYCKSCRKDFKIKENAATRPDLEQKIGSYFRKQCSHCLIENEYNVNDIFATAGSAPKWIGTGLGILIIIGATIFAWKNGYITTAGLVVGGIVILASQKVEESSDSRAFNKYRVRRKQKD